ncbi:ferredoxin [Phytoactinopolyspora halotolerans]|uniref:Ferredoxin n=1 Tax=Phytoactinopolyspora halotolerans TaxID=1981512 RepID=A0A6L9S901_9ACTN|nr:ferredoxin [Phytoactinopolyspora halotolerans]NEE01008.1 ferredoxin [Phytoactinopolyspora halotolerans]
MHVTVDRGRCDIHAQCVFEAPAVFQLDDDDELVYDERPEAVHRPAVERAATSCPVAAIRISER